MQATHDSLEKGEVSRLFFCGVCSIVSMEENMATTLVTDSRYAAHTLDGHPEHAGRLAAVLQTLESERLTGRLIRLGARLADEDDLQAVHVPGYLDLLRETARLDGIGMLDADTYVTPDSYVIARLAVGGVLQAVDAVMQGDADNALALIRPPGHHATRSRGMGFCLLNNIAIAARYAQRVCQVERVLIVDYDVHHGNGTQDVFYADPTVLYISTHQSPLYPGTGTVLETGEAEGMGFNLNIPLPGGVGDQGYAQVFEEIVVPAARQFAPQLMLISAGFDGHWADPLAGMSLSLVGYDHLARAVLAAAGRLCDGRIVFVMEGGYNLVALGNGWANIARALLGDREMMDPLGPSHSREPSVAPIIERVRQIHKLG
jgi:acetoin utilization deacetylase AcuC-like enzyme